MSVERKIQEQVESMTPEQQIERLVRQRNALWRLLDRFVLAYGDDESGDGLRQGDRHADDGVEVEAGPDGLIIRVRNPIDRVREFRRAVAALWDHCEEIVGNTYVVEGANYATGDIDRDTGLYTRIATETGEWRV